MLMNLEKKKENISFHLFKKISVEKEELE